MDEKELLSLPEEVLLHVASFLDLKTLLACSATCSYLRYVLNTNSVWKQHYNTSIVNYINSAKSVVKPEFKYHHETQSLERLCDERINLLKQNFLRNNWRHGRCVSNEVPLEPSPVNVWCKNINGKIIYRNTYLFLPSGDGSNHRYEVKVWNIEETPFLYTSVNLNINYAEDNCPIYNCTLYEVVNDHLVIIAGDLIHIFHINLLSKALLLEYVIYVDKEEAVSNFAESLYFDWLHYRSSIVGHLLFSHRTSSPVVHVWDILTGTKLKAFRLMALIIEEEALRWYFTVISFDDMDNVVFNIKITYPTIEYSYEDIFFVYSYSVSKDESSPVLVHECEQEPIKAMHYSSFIVLFCVCAIYVIDCESFSITAQESFNDLMYYDECHIVEDRIILPFENSVEIMNIQNLEVLQSFRIDGIEDIHYVPIFDASFFITSTLKNDTELWDIDRNQILLKFPKIITKGYYASYSKLVIVSSSTLIVKNFW